MIINKIVKSLSEAIFSLKTITYLSSNNNIHLKINENKQPSMDMSYQNSVLAKPKQFTTVQAAQMILKPNQLRNQILSYIDQFGQLKIENYWKSALTHPQYGYYQNKNVFSTQGDFTTSPQISSLFGQMIGVWIAYFIGIVKQKQNINHLKFRLVQLGPGRGLLMRDIVKALRDIGYINDFDITLIEVSQFNKKQQQKNIIQRFQKNDQFFKFQYQNQTKQVEKFTSQNQGQNINLLWVSSLEKLIQLDHQNQKQGNINPLTIFVCNQFFDALPTTIIKYTQQGWKQKVIKRSENQNLYMQLGISKSELPQKMRPNVQNPKMGQQVQISPSSLLIADAIAKIISKYGGCLLNIDYGGDGAYGDSIRAIKDHKYIPKPYFWQIPGECDLSAYVNFEAIGYFASHNNGIKCYQNIPQGFFLQAMGINPRIDVLSKNLNQDGKKKLQSQYKRLVLPTEMGQIYKVQLITKKQYGQLYPWIQLRQNQY